MSRVEKLRNKNKVVHERTKEEKEPVLRGGLYFIIIILLIGVLGYLLFFSGVFDLNNVLVNGYKNSDKINEIVMEVGESSLLSNNILFISKGEIKSIIEGDTRIKSVNIDKIYPSTIRVNIEETSPELIWSSAGEQFLVDGGGYVSSIANNENLVTVFDGSNIEVSLGERVASPTFIKFIKDLTENFEPVLGVEITKITIFDIMSDVHILSSDGWTVYLDTTKDAKSQLENLNKVLDEVGTKRKLEYIDMRLDTRVYYK